MHRSVRAKMIVQSLRGSGRMTVEELSRLTGASPVTIRRDLATLEAHGALRRVPGGAARAVKSGEELPYALRLGEDLERKTALAQAVCELISDHETVIIDNGTTCHAVATQLVGRPLTAVCLSLHSATVLASDPAARVVVPGGVVTTDTLAQMSTQATDAVRALSADVFVMGACAISARRGLVCDLPEDAAIKAAAIESSERRVLVTTADKLSRPSTFRFAAISELTHLMTTEDAPPAALEPFQDAGVQITIVRSV